MDTNLYIGIDIGTTAVKLVVLDEDFHILEKQYINHQCKVIETAETLFKHLGDAYGERQGILRITGQGGSDIAERWQFEYINEREALVSYLEKSKLSVDAVIEIGGESAKITYLKPHIDRHVNRVCAGGTGAFLENMAKLLGTDVTGLNELAEEGKKIYSIASRCGVFAKTDVQGLLNEGAEKTDVALSLFAAVVNQVVSGLSYGKPLQGRIVFLGGPLNFLPMLKISFQKELGLADENALCPENGVFYGALGAAYIAAHQASCEAAPVKGFLSEIRNEQKPIVDMVDGLFTDAKEYECFRKRHNLAKVNKSDLSNHRGALWMGIDAGSTTLKAVLINGDGAILKKWYGNHRGDILQKTGKILLDMYACLPENSHLAGVGVTGYGEGLLMKAFRLDFGEVETMAHLRAARFFCSEVTSLLDIGGQDMKYCRIKNGMIERISLNGVCSSGCGSFLETFAENLYMDIKEFSQKAVLAEKMPDLGRHCTVIMNSYVKKVQNGGVGLDGLAAALCVSVIRNALFSVIQLESFEDLGAYIVVEGGTFYNDAVLRAFERLTGKEAIRPDIAGLMGAYGMALKVKDQFGEHHTSSLLSAAEIKAFHMETENRTCPGCGNHCAVNIRRFSSGEIFITGNRCETGEMIFTRAQQGNKELLPDIYQWVKNHVFRKIQPKGVCKGVVGIPAVLDMWSDFPYWVGFWAALGYKVVTSDFTEQDAKSASMTIPRRVHCHPCLLAHAHIENLLRKKTDMIWFPAHKRGWNVKETDEKRHALYGHVIAKFMKGHIQKAKAAYLHPTLPEFGDDRLFTAMNRALPFIEKTELEKAMKSGKDSLIAYEKAYAEETERIWKWINKEQKPSFVLASRSCQVDAQIHKGIPYLVTSLGVPVLSSEGIALMEKWGELPLGGSRNENMNLDISTKMILKNPLLHLVVIRSVNCLLKRTHLDKIKKMHESKRKYYAEIILDQGVNTGAAKIRLRTLLAEIKEQNAFKG